MWQLTRPVKVSKCSAAKGGNTPQTVQNIAASSSVEAGEAFQWKLYPLGKAGAT
jgi:hypothetical protein